jgi:predicted enzyme related to lactoylglutathione lyase
MIEFIIYVESQERSRDFYQELLNKKPLLDVPGMTEFLLQENCKLGIMPNDGISRILGNKTQPPSAGTGIPRCEIYLFVNDPAGYFNKAVSLGAKAVSEAQDRDWGDRVAYVADPDGHILAFAEKIG